MAPLVKRLILVFVLGVIVAPIKYSVEAAAHDSSRDVRSSDEDDTKFIESLNRLLNTVSRRDKPEDFTRFFEKSCVDVAPKHGNRFYNILREYQSQFNEQTPSECNCDSPPTLPEDIAVLGTFLASVSKLPELTVEDCEKQWTQEPFSTLVKPLAKKLKLLVNEASKLLSQIQCKTVIAMTTTTTTTTTEKPTEAVTTPTLVSETPKFEDPEYEIKRYEYLMAGGHTERFVELYNRTMLELQPLLADIFLKIHDHFKGHDADYHAEDLYELIRQFYEMYSKAYKSNYTNFLNSFEDSFMKTFANHPSSKFEDKQKQFFHRFSQLFDAPPYSWSYPMSKRYKPKYDLLYLLDKMDVAKFDPYCVRTSLDAMGDQLQHLDYRNDLEQRERGLNIFFRYYVPCYKDVLEHLKPDSKLNWLKNHIDQAPQDFLQLYFRSLLMAGGTSSASPELELFWNYLRNIYDKLKANNLQTTDVPPDVPLMALDFYNDYTINGNIENLDRTVDKVVDVHKEVNDLVKNGWPAEEYLRKDSQEYYQNYYYPRLFWHILKNPVVDYEGAAKEKQKYEDKRHILRKAYGQHLQFFELFNFEIEQMLKGYRKGSSAYKTLTDVATQLGYNYGLDAFYRSDLIVPLFKEVFKYFNDKMHKRETFKEVFGDTFKQVIPDLDKVPLNGLHAGLINDFTSRFRYNYERKVGSLVESPLLRMYQSLQPKLDYDSFGELYEQVKERYKDQFSDQAFKRAYQDFVRSGHGDSTDDGLFATFYDKAYTGENPDWQGIEYFELLKSIADPNMRSVFDRIMKKLGNEYKNAARILGIVKFLPTDFADFVRLFVELYRRYGFAGIGVYSDEFYRVVGVLYYVITQKNPDGSTSQYTRVERCLSKHFRGPFYVYGRINGDKPLEVCGHPNKYRRIHNKWLLRALDNIRYEQ